MTKEEIIWRAKRYQCEHICNEYDKVSKQSCIEFKCDETDDIDKSFDNIIMSAEKETIDKCIGIVDEFIKKLPRCFPRYKNNDVFSGDVEYTYLNEDLREDLRNYILEKMKH